MSAADCKAQVKALADVLDGCPLDIPCNLMCTAEGWCRDHCKDGQASPDAECWLEYARVMTENKTESDHITDSDKMVKLKKRTITERLIIAKSLIDSVITDSERVSLSGPIKSNTFPKKPSEDSESEMNNSDEWWKNYIRARMSQDDAPDFHVGKTDFQPGDKFILELGAERRMFDEFEIAGTDLYVKTDLLEKLTRYKPETVTNCHDLTGNTISRQAAIDATWFEPSYTDPLNVLTEVRDRLNVLPSTQPEVKPIDYRDCANAMLKMWMWDVVTDGEYYRIMDKLNKHELERRTNDSD